MRGGGHFSFTGLIIYFIGYLLFGRKKRSRTPISQISASEKQKRKDNCDRMQIIADRFKDYTAEVIPFYVRVVSKVYEFRQANIGQRVEIKLIKHDLQVFYKNEFIANLYPDSGSRLKQLIRDNVRFNAYLGGRDLSYRFDTDIDSCSVIIFYQLPGVPPTKVILKDS